ncbi:MAG TPA: PilZ domain-containing protein [Thermoanaerobaculia bacterium]
MAEERFSTRKRRRYLIEWQSDDSLCTGFTHDISPTGIFVRSTYIEKIGAILTMQLLLPEGGKLRIRGIVVRSHRIPQHLRGVVPSGFGVRLKEAPEEYFRLLADLFGLRFAS